MPTTPRADAAASPTASVTTTAVSEQPGGMRLATSQITHERSAAVGVLVDIGSADEDPATLGKSHFLEHLCFKGARGRNAREIAHAIESLGGSCNAYTGLIRTAFYAHVPARHLERALEIVTSVAFEPHLDAADLEAERSVIANEMRSYNDYPDSVAATALDAALFPHHPLGRPIIGTPETLEAITAQDLRTWHGAHYVPANVVLSVAGPYAHDEVATLAAPFISGANIPDTDIPTTDVTARAPRQQLPSPTPAERYAFVARETEQAQVLLAWPSLPTDHPGRYAARVLRSALSNGMSSRLFQEVRERRGLCYSVHARFRTYDHRRAFVVGLSCAPADVAQAVEVAHDVVLATMTDGISDTELADAIEAERGNYEMRPDSSLWAMLRFGDGLLDDLYVPLEEEIARISAVTQDDLAAVGPLVLGGPVVLAVVGPQEPSALSVLEAPAA